MITVIVGAQYGGEGKGKVAAYLAKITKPDITCRCGGPNSSHTVVHDGVTHKLRMMPAAAVIDKNITVVFGAGSFIHIETLFSEIQSTGHFGRVVISPLAGVIDKSLVLAQRADSRYDAIGSTLTGTGYAASERSLRRLPLARDYECLAPFINDTEMLLWSNLERNILIEGHQGYGLSNYHGDYPYVSSRDSTAAGMLSELGLGPSLKNLNVVLAAKIFPTRNHAGNIGSEMSSFEAQKLGINEFGGGAWGIINRRRRVGLFDIDIVFRAARANSASCIALTGADYFDKNIVGKNNLSESTDLRDFIRSVRSGSRVKVRYVSTGPDTEAMIDLESQQESAQRAFSS